MKIDFNNSSNKSEINSVRSQIKSSSDLKKFDDFLTKHNSFDTTNRDHLETLRLSGPQCCPDIDITIQF